MMGYGMGDLDAANRHIGRSGVLALAKYLSK